MGRKQGLPKTSNLPPIAASGATAKQERDSIRFI